MRLLSSGFFFPVSQNVLISYVFSSRFLPSVLQAEQPVEEGCHVNIVVLVEFSTEKKQECLSRQWETALGCFCPVRDREGSVQNLYYLISCM